MNDFSEFDIQPGSYRWTERVFDVLRRFLRVNIKLHDQGDKLETGDVFLFNHFARFETFIPQYLIYKETGAFCRSVASAEFFGGDDVFAGYLRSVGAIPNDLPGLLPFLAGEILAGRKIVVFPEGGMVKDRRVLDGSGEYSVYSRTALERRKHHTGAAVIALAVDAFKHAVRQSAEHGGEGRLAAWARACGLDGPAALAAVAARPTRIIPANITFYPLRVSDNLLRRGADLLSRGLSRRMSEELLVEGNILLEHTDMDIRLGAPIEVGEIWSRRDLRLMEALARRIETHADMFALLGPDRPWSVRRLGAVMVRASERVRDEYMRRMYSAVTVHLSHLASRVMIESLDRGVSHLPKATYEKLVYLAVKRAQREPDVHLHRSLRNPSAYGGLLRGDCDALERLLATAESSALVQCDGPMIRFLPKLRDEHAFDEIRLENLVEVYSNEIEPVAGARRAIARAFAQAPDLDRRAIALELAEDETIAWEWDRDAFSKPRHRAVNERETRTRSGEPFLLLPDSPRAVGVVAVHGFLASPAEMRGLADRLFDDGYGVVGVRLKGHGTSPWDLRERSFEEWLQSVRDGFRIASGLFERVVVVGFSTGGALGLCLAAEEAEGLAGVVAAGVPLRFQNPNMRFVPIVHQANRFVRWASTSEGVMPFRPNQSEHPDINYYQMPVRGLYELTRLVPELESRLPSIACPVLLLQGAHDPVVVPDSVHMLAERMTRTEATVKVIDADRHGIINEDLDGTQAIIHRFIAEF